MKYSPNVDCAEEMGSATESYDDSRGVARASVTLRCAYDSRHTLVADVCGNRRDWPRTVAGVQPKAATAAIVPVQTLHGSSDPDGVDEQAIVYGEALVTINYTTENVDVVSESIEPYVEFVTLDHRAFRWGRGNGPQLREEEAPGKLIRGINFVRNELDLTTLDGNLLSFLGHVNSIAITGTILNFTFAPETLLVAPPSVSFKRTSLGDVKFDVTKKFTLNPQGWNVYYRPQTNTYERIFAFGSATAYNSYPVSDISGMF